MDREPATIGKYRIQRVLGRGGMGTVYEALDPLINRKVAIKTMIPGLADSPDLRARFLREAQAAGGLRHRNIVTVYDLGEDKGQPYIAMEFIEGTDLEKIIQKQEPHPLEWKLEVIRQLCDGLAYAHKAGIVHRDVKPANVRVTPEGDVKIMDFGIAHLQSSTMTKSGLVLGTVHYMAPEQIAGAKVDHRADIFSVGAIAYELLAGRKPFDGDTLTAVMFKVMHERPDPAGLPKSEFSPALETVVMRALARGLDERYQTLDEMHAELARLLRDASGRAHQQRQDPALALVKGAREQREAGRLTQALHLAREAVRLVPGHSEAVSLVGDLEQEERRARVAQWVEQGRAALAGGDDGRALQLADQALGLEAEDAAAQRLKAEALAGREVRLRREVEALRAEAHRARTEGQLQKAVSLAKRILQLDPGDKGAQRDAADLEGVIRDREVEQLCGVALAYVADGDTELALKIAQRIEKLAPANQRYLQLRKYLDEEVGRKEADALTATARDHLALGNLAEALAAAEAALELAPDHALARDIRDRSAAVLEAQERRAAKSTGVPAAPAPPPPPVVVAVAPPPPPVVAAPPPPVRAEARHDEPPATIQLPRAVPPPVPPRPVTPAPAASPPPRVEAPPPPPAAPVRPAPAPAAAAGEPLPPLPEGQPQDPEAARLVDGARLLLRDRQPQKALPLLEQASQAQPGHAGIQRLLEQTRVEARKVEVESLNNTALDHFLKNNYAKAKKAAEKVLALDPSNKKAKDLMKILGPLG